VVVLTWIMAEHPDWVNLALGLVCLGALAGGAISLLACLMGSLGRSSTPVSIRALVLVKDSSIRVTVKP
jgi:hypothetical protein